MSLAALWYLVILIAGHAEALTSTLPRFTLGWPDQVVVCVVTIHKGDAFPPGNLLVDLEHVLQVVVVYVKTYRDFGPHPQSCRPRSYPPRSSLLD
jgi:hypothetical protein